MSVWRALVPVLLGGAAVGAFLRSVNASDIGRVAGLIAVLSLVTVGVGVWRGRKWALGAAFFLGLFWLWAALALGIQDVIVGAEAAGWLTWSIIVMVGSVRARAA